MKTKLIICLTALLLTAQTLTARRLVFIGLDGWAGNTYEQSDMPYVKQLAKEGAMTLEKRAVLPSSSAINWASIFMGAGPEVHGYLNWGSKAPEMQQPTGTVKTHNIFPTVFQLARQQKPDVRMGLFYEWDGIKYLTDTLAFDHHEQTKDGHTAQIAAEYIKANKPDVTVIVFDNPDHTGHGKGWGSPEYYATMMQLDKDVATIISAVKDAGMADDTVVMVTGDHGGSGTGHGGTNMAEVNSPLIMWGAGIQPGTVITDMVIGYDLAATMAHIIGIDTPRCWRGRTIDQAFEGYLPRSIYSGLQGKHHVQGIAVDIARGYVYFSFTTRLVKTDMQGRLIGSIEGLTGHLGCLALNPDDGKIYASLEYKDDAIGRGISGDEATKRENAWYIAVFDGEKITRPGMKAPDGAMTTVYLPTVVKDYTAKVTNGGKTVDHRYGCAGVDGVAFAPLPGNDGGKNVLYVAYGVYSDTGRTDNDYQVLLTYDTRDWEKYGQIPAEGRLHHAGPAKPLARYFVYTGNTSWGVQNLCYDPFSGTLFAAVYKGKKKTFPNYSLFAIDLSDKARKQKLKGFGGKESRLVLPLKELGQHDKASDIYGWHFPYGSTGLCAIGNGLFYISHNSGHPEENTTLHLYRYDGGTTPFVEVQ